MRRVIAVSGGLRSASFVQRVGMFIEPLRRMGYDVAPVEYPGFLRRPSLFLGGSGAEIVWLRRRMLDPLTAAFARRSRVPIVFDFDDAILLRSEPRHGSYRSRGRERRFTRTLRAAAAVTAGSPHLVAEARRHHPRVHLVPTGLDASLWPRATAGSDDGRLRLVWIGSRSTLPFLLERREVFRRLAERNPSLRLRVICDEFPQWTDVPIEAMPWSRETEVERLRGADVGLAPLPDTPFTRGKCGFKVIQYMAAGLPVVASPVGCHREMVEEDANGYLATSDDDWIAAIERLMESRDLRERLGRRGRTMVEERYDVGVLAPRIAAVFDEVLS